MVEKTKKQKANENNSGADELQKYLSDKSIKLRGRTFEGEVITKLQGRVKIQFERFVYDRKYERFDKRRTKLHARLPEFLANKVQIGDWIQITECRPLSKIIHFIVTKKIRSKHEQGKENKE